MLSGSSDVEPTKTATALASKKSLLMHRCGPAGSLFLRFQDGVVRLTKTDGTEVATFDEAVAINCKPIAHKLPTQNKR